MATQGVEGVIQMKPDTQKYCIMALDTGVKGLARYDRFEANRVVHYLHIKYPDERYCVCAV